MENYDFSTDKAFAELPSVLTIEQLADALAVSRSTVYRLVNTRQLRTIKVGRTVRITKDSLIRYLNDTMSA